MPDAPTPHDAEASSAHAPVGYLGLGAMVGAVVSSACCWLPLLLAFGLSAGGAAGFFETVRPFFLVAAVLFLGSGFYLTYFRKAACQPGDACAMPNPKFRRFNRTVLWVATTFAIISALFPYYSPALVRAFAAPPAAANTTTTLIIRVYRVEGMTCAGCAAALEGRLAKLPGVAEAHVSFDDATATIQSTPAEPGDETVQAAAQRLGFQLAARPDP